MPQKTGKLRPFRTCLLHRSRFHADDPKERIWQEAGRLRAAHQAVCALPVKVLDLAEFDLHLDLVPVNGLREQLDIDALLMGDLKPILVGSYSGKIRHCSSLTPFKLFWTISKCHHQDVSPSDPKLLLEFFETCPCLPCHRSISDSGTKPAHEIHAFMQHRKDDRALLFPVGWIT